MLPQVLKLLTLLFILLGAIVAHDVDAQGNAVHTANQIGGGIRPRKLAPEFTAKSVIDDKFHDISIRDYRGKWVVMLFYPYGRSLLQYNNLSSLLLTSYYIFLVTFLLNSFSLFIKLQITLLCVRPN